MDANDIPQVGRTTTELEELANDAAMSRTLIRSMKAKANEHRTPFERIADRLRSGLGSIPILIAHMVFLAGWIVINSGLLLGFEPFDPQPFPILAVIVATEALV